MNIREYAYIGDAVWELFVREQTVNAGLCPKKLHNAVTSKVNAGFQHALLEKIQDELTEDECEIVRRGRNLSIPTSRKSIQNDYRHATGFEAIIGFWYINDSERLKEFEEILKKYL